MSKSSSTSQPGYSCTLSPQVLEKAIKELNEDPNTRLIEVKNLKIRLEKLPGLQPRTDVRFLLRFLRARKFDQERSFQLVKNYYDVRLQSPEIFDDLKPSRVRHVLEDGTVEVLKQRDNNGCKVIVIRPGNWNPDHYPFTEVPKAVFLLMWKILEDEETQVSGIHLINNLAGFTLKHAAHFNPGIAKTFMGIIQDVLPLRLKRYDFVNEPTFFDVVFAIIKQFMKDKLVKRIVMNGDKFDKIHSTIPPEFLPTDLGGQLPPHSNKELLDSLLASDAQFEEDNKFGFVQMKVNSGKSVSKSGDADMQGLGGTFKKLDI
ncbi:unnamed protein product [Candidula unifasciata]|uniref:CRAL-TRIO domain-containing protein n=1 Tax=Candidula unifasciata TaxID=100452 RepID=A0A8S3ZF25_9EUPU|nr:unnamed protein product [Candidula unifasciata]